MSTRAFFVAGVDLSLLPSQATNAQILQAIQEAKPASGLGILIYQSTTPDVSTYTEYATFIWINTTTTELKYWNGTSWQLITGKASISDASVTISKLAVTGGTALQLIRVNAAATAFEFVNPADLFSTNSFPLNKLVNAAGAGYVMYSGGGGVWSSSLLTTLLDAWLLTKDIPAKDVTDVTGEALPNQVMYFPASFDSAEFAYVEALLRNNQTPTGKLQFAAGSAGKFAKVNAGGTDLEYVTDTGQKSAVIKYTVAASTVGQAITTTGSLQTVQFNTEVDPSGIVSIASNQFTLGAGTYLIEAAVPINRAGGPGDANVVVVLRDITGASNLATATAWNAGGGGDQTVAVLKYPIVLTVSNVFEIQLVTDVAIELGNPANQLSLAETYQQVSIIKLA